MLWRSALVVAAVTALWSPASALETIYEKCARLTQDNASYGNCINRLTQEETQNLKGMACSHESCVIKLTCGEPTRTAQAVCTGSGYIVTYLKNSRFTGNEIQIKPPNGRMSVYSSCGTCKSIEHESGPLHGAEIRMAGDNEIVLEVPR